MTFRSLAMRSGNNVLYINHPEVGAMYRMWARERYNELIREWEDRMEPGMWQDGRTAP